jgi:hypothetical protein
MFLFHMVIHCGEMFLQQDTAQPHKTSVGLDAVLEHTGKPFTRCSG